MSFLRKIVDLYVDGFRNMTIGRTLWAIIIIKLVIIFLVLKLFFFPNYIRENAEEGEEAEFVNQQIQRVGQSLELSKNRTLEPSNPRETEKK